MNGNELVAEVLDWVQDTSFGKTAVLNVLNQGQVAIASRILLPGLSNGYDTITTVTDDYKVALPSDSDYMKACYHAQTSNVVVDVYQSLSAFLAEFPYLQTTRSSLMGIVITGGELVYQGVPASATDIEIRYYRKPTPMTTRSDSTPDGVEFGSDVAENYERALVHYAVRYCYAKIEQGDGRKEDTAFHNGEYERYVKLLDTGSPKNRPHPKPPICEGNWANG